MSMPVPSDDIMSGEQRAKAAITFECLGCNKKNRKRITVPDRTKSLRFTCPRCGKTQDVPDGQRIVSEHASAVVGAMLERSQALKRLSHQPTKGQFRELLVAELLRFWLPSQCGLASGVIINRNGEQSRQCDVVIYDNRLLPPFIFQQRPAMIPVETVLAAIEVKTRLTTDEVDDALKWSEHMVRNVLEPTEWPPILRPMLCVLGFQGTGKRELQSNTVEAKHWLDRNAAYIVMVALAGCFSWARMGGRGWVYAGRDKQTHEETKRFFAVLIDNCRTLATRRWRRFRQHLDLESMYLRDPNRTGPTDDLVGNVDNYVMGCIRRERERLAEIFRKHDDLGAIADEILADSLDHLVFQRRGPGAKLHDPNGCAD